MASPSAIPAQVETYDQIPARLRPAYELSPLGWYEPNQVGATIGAYRAAIEKDPHREPLAPRRSGMGINLDSLLADSQALGAGTGHVLGVGTGVTVTTGPINVTVNVGQTGASPQIIGEATGNAVASGLRGALSDVGPSP